MKAIIYFSLSKEQTSKAIAHTFEGDVFRIKNTGKNYKTKFAQMFMYGYKTVFNKKVDFSMPEINFENYDEIVLVSPVWAGRVNVFMRQYLEKAEIKNKNITIIGSCDGGYKNYFESYEGILDESNIIVEKVIYVKGERRN
ncbi:MAG: hypothetical protein KJ847_02640 [Firmicutes bacterium]|nr:hypothetical protein [Bacillota bacterium]